MLNALFLHAVVGIDKKGTFYRLGSELTTYYERPNFNLLLCKSHIRCLLHASYDGDSLKKSENDVLAASIRFMLQGRWYYDFGMFRMKT